MFVTAGVGQVFDFMGCFIVLTARRPTLSFTSDACCCSSLCDGSDTIFVDAEGCCACRVRVVVCEGAPLLFTEVVRRALIRAYGTL